MAARQPEQILRYRLRQRLVHALLGLSFLALLFTGLPLLWPALSFLDFGPISRLIHRAGAIGFMLVPILYLLLDRRGARELIVESFRYDRDDFAWMKRFFQYFSGRTAGMPPQGRLNAGQKIHHAGVIIMSAAVVFSGLFLWLGKAWLTGTTLAATALIHDLAMFLLTILLVGHLYFTYVYKALSGMTTGYIDRQAAELEHAKWVAELYPAPLPSGQVPSPPTNAPGRMKEKKKSTNQPTNQPTN